MAEKVTLAEIAAALGVTKVAVSQRAGRESWQYEEEGVRGGRRRLYPLASLPAQVRSTVVAKRTESLVVSSAVVPAAGVGHLPAPLKPAGAVTPAGTLFCGDLTDKQRLERDARKGVVTAIERLQTGAGCSKEAAMTTLLINARAGKLEPTLDAMLRLARDPRGRQGDGFPSVRTLKRWLASQDLTPKRPSADMTIPAWAKDFLTYYQTPQKPSVEAAYRDYAKAATGEIPTIHQVRRFLGKLGTVTRERGRMGTRELKNIQPFIRRDFSLLEPNDIWTADGHTFDAEVQHPLHGRPFRPEITAILDVATRRAVGWSVDLAESSLAVLDALRYAVERNGIPAIFYVDNGSGYSNAMMKDEATGLLGRLGTTISHSLPYNSQARGVIERSHQTIWVQAAKQLPSYVGAAMDREARLQQFKLTRQALKKGGAMPLMPWDLFVQFVEERIAEYNARAHRTLKGVSPDLCWRSFETRGFQADRMGQDEMATLFRPRVTRVIQRAEIALFTNIYFAQELAEFHGLDAHVAYDIHDPSKVWVYAPDGRFICEAQANGNRRHYMPVPVVQQAREKRAKGRLSRVDSKRQEILEELHGSPALPAAAAGQIVIGGRILDREALEAAAVRVEEPAPDYQAIEVPGVARLPMETPAEPKSRRDCSPEENYADWLEIDRRVLAGEAVSETDARWHRTYQQSAQFRAESKKKAAA